MEIIKVTEFKDNFSNLKNNINSENSKTILTMLNEVVNLGTAKSLDLNGYKIGGKTGTAQKFINGEYSKNEFISSFTSIFPIDRPKYVMVVSIDLSLIHI